MRNFTLVLIDPTADTRIIFNSMTEFICTLVLLGNDISNKIIAIEAPDGYCNEYEIKMIKESKIGD